MASEESLDAHHYPTDFLHLLTDTLFRLCKGRQDVLTFFRSCGVPPSMYADFQKRLDAKEPVPKATMAREVLTRVNDAGYPLLRARREIVRRVVQTEDYTACWPEDQLPAQGLVARVRERVNQQDAFTRMTNERDAEAQQHRAARRAELQAKADKAAARQQIAERLGALAREQNPQKRGMALEAILNDYFRLEGISIRESFQYRSEIDGKVLEQIDGVVAFGGDIYLVEVKWWNERLSAGDLALHMVRAGSRAGARGIVVSASGYTDAAIATCKDQLGRGVFVLAEVSELLLCAQRDQSLADLLTTKVNAAIVDRRPLHIVA